jgi:FMN reductase
MATPLIVGVGGTLRRNSSTEKALRHVLAAAEQCGARTLLFSGPDLDLPIYSPERLERTAEVAAVIAALRDADGVVLGSPGYHGGVSGLVKNVLDYTEDLRDDARCYLEGRAVGCIGTGGGWQGATAALGALRNIVHALRGWNTPLGVAINTAEPAFDEAGACLAPRLGEQLDMMADQIVNFAVRHATAKHSGPPAAALRVAAA